VVGTANNYGEYLNTGGGWGGAQEEKGIERGWQEDSYPSPDRKTYLIITILFSCYIL